MKSIHKLPPRVANQIAAGEVITEPLSVIKELLENSLDAGATKIHLEISKGGLDKILMIDDGEGIHFEDASLLFERHSTSKITQASDLQSIESFGFRGEALASIAAISKITLSTRHQDEMQGFEAIAYGGQMLSVKRISREIGTSFLVQDLFYNTPVRESFLNKPKQLESKITDFLLAMALGNPRISFRYHSDERLIFQTFGGGEEETLLQLLGEEAKHLLPLELLGDTFHVEGYLSNLSISKTTRKNQYFFVNGRLVENQDLLDAVKKTYEGLLPQRRFPMVLLKIQIPPREVDVNIHPRKMEVRFSEKTPLIHELETQLRPQLYKRNLLPKLEQKNPTPAKAQRVENIVEELNKYEIEEIPMEVFETFTLPEKISTELLVKKEDFFSQEDLFEGLHYIGQLFGTYLLFEKKNYFYLCDQHAAHEKILYEKFMAEYHENRFASQFLLLPESLSLGAKQVQRLEERSGILKKVGFEFEAFSHQQIVLRSIPHLFTQSEAKAFFLDLLEETQAVMDEESIISRSCKAAIKAKDSLQPLEVHALIDQLKVLKDPYTCPHGRPIIVQGTRRELENRFER